MRPEIEVLLKEVNELVAITVSSIKIARINSVKKCKNLITNLILHIVIQHRTSNIKNPISKIPYPK